MKQNSQNTALLSTASALLSVQSELASARAESAAAKEILRSGIDRGRDEKDTLHALATVTVNGIYLRDQEIKELRRDKERLDWLDENMSYHGGGNGGTYSFFSPADLECGMLRAAIDAASAPKQADQK